MDEDAYMQFYVLSGGERYEQEFMVTGWAEWKNPRIEGVEVTDGELTVGAYIRCGAKAWGTLDDFSVTKSR